MPSGNAGHKKFFKSRFLQFMQGGSLFIDERLSKIKSASAWGPGADGVLVFSPAPAEFMTLTHYLELNLTTANRPVNGLCPLTTEGFASSQKMCERRLNLIKLNLPMTKAKMAPKVVLWKPPNFMTIMRASRLLMLSSERKISIYLFF